MSAADVGVRWRQLSGTQPLVPSFPGTR
jgi:hypothetical protein